MLVESRRNSGAADDQHGGRRVARMRRLEPRADEPSAVGGANDRRSLRDRSSHFVCRHFVTPAAQWRVCRVGRHRFAVFMVLAYSNLRQPTHLPTRRELIRELNVYATPQTARGLALFVLDIALYASALAGVLFVTPWWAKIVCGVF